MTVVMDFDGLSLSKHYYWPGIEMVKEVSICYPSFHQVTACLQTQMFFIVLYYTFTEFEWHIHATILALPLTTISLCCAE